MAKVVTFLADGFEEIEALTAVDILRRGGAEVVTVSISDRKLVHGSHDINVEADAVFAEADIDSADMLFLPGGKKGTENLDNCEPVKEKIRKFLAEDKYVAAICAAPTVLGHMGVLNGRRATCYGGLEGELKGALISADHVVVDGNIITSRGMGTSLELALKLLEIFTDEDTARKMAASVMLDIG